MEVEKKIDHPSYLFFQGGSEMSHLANSFDWAKTSMGSPEQWEHSLRTITKVVLTSKFPMLLMWGKDHVQLYNDAYRQMLGNNGKHPQALGQRAADCWPEIYDTVFGLIKHVYETGEATWHEDQLVPIYRNGKMEEVYWTHTYAPVTNDTGIIEGILVVCQETTAKIHNEQSLIARVAERTEQLMLAQNNLEQKVAELQRSNKNLQDFAYAASHDMKEPVRKIGVFAGKLKSSLEKSISAKDKDYFDRMINSCNRMGLLIDDLLTYSKVNYAPKTDEPVDLNLLIQEVLGVLDLETEEKMAKIIVSPLPVIHGNKRQLQQAFQNLISNALKYTLPGVPPIIQISADKSTGSAINNNLIRKLTTRYHVITVADNGIGFDQEDAERIFDVFTRLHGNADYKGTGIGLSIVKKVIEEHDGFITAIGVPGEGAKFTIYIPEYYE